MSVAAVCLVCLSVSEIIPKSMSRGRYHYVSHRFLFVSQMRGDDDNDVTYCTVKAPSSSAATTADPDNLYSTVNFPIT